MEVHVCYYIYTDSLHVTVTIVHVHVHIVLIVLTAANVNFYLAGLEKVAEGSRQL